MAELLKSDQGAVRILTLNRPEKRNALNDELIEALKNALREADADESVNCVVLRGAGKDFCSGADLSALQKIAEASYEENLEDARNLAELFSLIRNCRVPVIAAVHGRALAGGCGLATGCDIVLATETARFGYPEVKIGFVPAIVMAILRRNLGEKLSFELVTQGFEFTAVQAKELGLVNRLFPEEGFEEAVLEYASVYSKISASAVRLSKSLLYRMDAMNFEDALTAGSQTNAEARMTEDCQKGIERFLAK
ncbi:MAG: enoyl-CoA hydratase/isomerase family protein [Acidobacteria bacterium]|nr:enoyl-CoA hydratase/isomerase family protein [Acidobacteriota bacterium]